MKKVFALALTIATLGTLPTWWSEGWFLLRDDFFFQQIPFIVHSKRMLLAHGLYHWDWTAFLGADFLGSYAFYTLGSPFFWLLLLVPNSLLLPALGVVHILKFGVGAVGAFWYLRKLKITEFSAAVGALLYVFSGFSLVNSDFYHFMDVIALFPFWLGAVEHYLQGEKHGGVLLSLVSALQIITNFYFAQISLLFIGFYVLLRPYATKVKLRSWGFMGLGMALTGFFTWPILMQICTSSRVASSGWDNLFLILFPTNYLERLRVLFMPTASAVFHPFWPRTYSWKSTGAYLPIFGPLFALAWIVKKPKHWVSIIVLVLVITSLLPPVNGIWQLWSNPDYTRHWYILVLFLATATALTLDHKFNEAQLQHWTNITIIVLAGGGTVLLLLHPSGHESLGCQILTLTILGYLGLKFLLRNNCAPSLTWLFITLCVSANMMIFHQYNNQALRHDYPDPGKAYFKNFFAQYDPQQSPLPQHAGRVAVQAELVNVGTYFNTPTLSAQNSMRSARLNDFLKLMQVPEYYAPAVEIALSDSALLSLLGTQSLSFYRSGKFHNQAYAYALPFGFGYDQWRNHNAANPDISAKHLLHCAHVPPPPLNHSRG